MIRGLYTSASGMLSEMVRNDVTANNLANVNTTGYKKDVAVFRSFPEILVQRLNDKKPTDSSSRPIIGSMVTGAVADEIVTSYEQGQLRETSNPFDLAIVGDGFFAVQNENGIFYTRNGSFTLDSQGYLVNSEGAYVLGQAGPIRIADSEDVVIDKNGNIFAAGAMVDRLRLVTFADPRQLTKIGDSLFTGGQPIEGIPGQVRQRFIEASNVNPITEMVNMITIARAYEANQKVITAHDHTLGKALEIGSLR